MTESIEGEVTRVTFENPENAFRVIRIAHREGSLLSVLGTMPPVHAGARIRAQGRFEHDPKHGRQFRAEHVTVLAPDTLFGLERYLGSGAMKGIGPTFAKRIVAHFGLKTLEVLEETPQRLLEIPGLGKRRASEITQGWKAQRLERDALVFLQGHGIPPALALRIVRRYGARTEQVVTTSPYRLASEVWGVGFRTADELALALGAAPLAVERLSAALLFALSNAAEEGHCYLHEPTLFEETRKLLRLSEEGSLGELLSKALATLQMQGEVVVEEGRTFARRWYDAEVTVAKGLRERQRSYETPKEEPLLDTFEKKFGMVLSEEQRAAVREAVHAPVFVLTGGPGVGKTTILRAMLFVLSEKRKKILLSAPTGRAAKRMQETTRHEAVTLHRLLEVDPNGGAFRRNRHNFLEGDVLIIDEVSMVDVAMMAAIVEALPPTMQLLLVGDADQLPSVGAGAVLSDLLLSEQIPHRKLVKIFRQAESSLIVKNAHRVNEGLFPQDGDDKDRDFFLIQRPNAEAVADTVLELVTTRIPRKFGFDPVRDIQVLVPMHRGASGAESLNQRLQEALCPKGASVTRGRTTFRVGDKVMQLRNDYDRNVYNGDLGIVSRVDVESAELFVRFDEREVGVDEQALAELGLAYACTVHKSQGSEYPVVVIALSTEHYLLLRRNLLYTAMTRGKKLVVLVTERRALSLCLDDARTEPRKTRLSERLRLTEPSALT